MDNYYFKHLNTLELPKVLKMLSCFCSCADSAERADALLPEGSFESAEQLLGETECAYLLIARYTAPSFGGIKNVDSALTRAASGSTLTPAELLHICEVLRVTRSLYEWHRNNHLQGNEALDRYFDALYPNKFLEDKIQSAIITEDEISDSASPELYSIRRKIRKASDSVREQLDKIIHSSSMRNCLQDPIVTMRSGRYVVPVKAEFRAQVPGLVHDTSASGSTVFVEPNSVVEANNAIRVLESQEKAEIDRILAELSALCGEFANNIKISYDQLISLDLIFAKAKFAYDINASRPVLNQNGITELRRARHPLLNRKTVVPTDISLGDKFTTLVITGPNTGGKTVALKTLGLLSIMALCGLFIPAGENSRVAVYDKILCDIGDEQSIEQSLSTFSAHMTNIIEILARADKNSLILIDELGAGTDPAEGAALAVSILEQLREKGCKIAATTHYAELKMYALQTPGVVNGCCEFDVKTLRPTYRLLIGLPGRSNAFAILSRLGMNKEIIDRAKSLLSEDDSRFDDAVGKLEESHITLEREKQDIADIKAKARAAEQKAREHTEKLDRERERIISEAKKQAERIVEKARSRSDELLEELESIKKQSDGKNAAEQLRAARAAAKKGIRSLEDSADPAIKKLPTAYRLPRPLKAGDTVEIIDIDKRATVLEAQKDRDTVTVMAGIIKTTVKTDNLRLIENAQPQGVKPATRTGVRTVHSVESRATRAASPEIDLRGKRADEALLELDGFIDNAVMSGISTVTVIHGKGTGALRDAVREFLRSNRSVKTFRRGVFGEGEDGVTVAELK